MVTGPTSIRSDTHIATIVSPLLDHLEDPLTGPEDGRRHVPTLFLRAHQLRAWRYRAWWARPSMRLGIRGIAYQHSREHTRLGHEFGHELPITSLSQPHHDRSGHGRDHRKRCGAQAFRSAQEVRTRVRR